jgi:preprotein translocase subunit SecF
MPQRSSMKFSIIKYTNIWLGITVAIVLTSLISLAYFGLNLGIDFTGGSLYEWDFKTADITNDQIRNVFNDNGLDPLIQSSDAGIKLIRTASISTEQYENLSNSMREVAEFEQLRFESIGPVIGQELQRRSTVAVVLLLLTIGAYVAYTFRKVSRPVASWKYGLVTIIASAHDIIITLGVFAFLGSWLGYQIDTAFIAALLTILGYSINDTIVVFDRIRENVLQYSHVNSEEYVEIVDTSVRQTLARSINTSLTTLLVLFAVYFFGGETVKNFVLALIVGITAGAYSSVFMASPLLTKLVSKD